jgi:drug/metabolite transporter (DMT)-like permease
VYAGLGGAVLIWAANWAMTKSVLHDISPVSFVAYRFLTAAPFMAALTILIRQALLPVRGERLPLALIGIVQIAGSQCFSTVGLQYVAAGRTVVLMYTMQLWALPLGWLINRDRASLPALCGGALGFSGLFLFFNTPPVNWRDPQVVLGNCLCLGGGLSWALGACLYRRRKWQTPFWTQTFWQVLWTAVAVAPLLLGPQRATVWTAPVMAMIAYNSIACTALAWWWWGKALAVMPASRAGHRHSDAGVCGHHRRPLGRRAADARHCGECCSHLSGNCARAARQAERALAACQPRSAKGSRIALLRNILRAIVGEPVKSTHQLA